MTFTFEKYQGTGNDFVMVDNRERLLPELTQEQIAHICHRRFGVGADGFILIEPDVETDFKMVYYNSDGRQSTMCGNGGRCSVMFAHKLGMVGQRDIRFTAIDGLHTAEIEGEVVHLGMSDVPQVEVKGSDLFIDTGSPHHVKRVSDLANFNVHDEGKRVRNEIYGEEGSNVNFIEWEGTKLHVRTYERGVEGETYSCGTGVTAAALAAHHFGETTGESVDIITPGGALSVRFNADDSGYTQIVLSGPAQKVFEGSWPQ